jgi:conjugative transfer signal peptidase TraF
MAAVFAAVPCAATVALSPPPLLLWNASASTPRGLYRVLPGARIHRGDSAIASLPERYRTLAARRGYLPLGVPLVKRVAAVPGDRICARGATISIDGKTAAIRKKLDARGRKLPASSGCAVLRSGEYLLLGESPWSFDGRYFGPTRSTDIIGRAVLLWRA